MCAQAKGLQKFCLCLLPSCEVDCKAKGLAICPAANAEDTADSTANPAMR